MKNICHYTLPMKEVSYIRRLQISNKLKMLMKYFLLNRTSLSGYIAIGETIIPSICSWIRRHCRWCSSGISQSNIHIYILDIHAEMTIIDVWRNTKQIPQLILSFPFGSYFCFIWTIFYQNRLLEKMALIHQLDAQPFVWMNQIMWVPFFSFVLFNRGTHVYYMEHRFVSRIN